MAGSRPSDKEKGGGHPGPEITGGAGVRRGGGLKKRFFVHGFGPQFVLKIRGGTRAPPASPLDPPL